MERIARDILTMGWANANGIKKCADDFQSSHKSFSPFDMATWSDHRELNRPRPCGNHWHMGEFRSISRGYPVLWQQLSYPGRSLELSAAYRLHSISYRFLMTRWSEALRQNDNKFFTCRGIFSCVVDREQIRLTGWFDSRAVKHYKNIFVKKKSVYLPHFRNTVIYTYADIRFEFAKIHLVCLVNSSQIVFTWCFNRVSISATSVSSSHGRTTGFFRTAIQS